jgi:predicted TIM-barrel fold metal-dependent hydrolase
MIIDANAYLGIWAFRKLPVTKAKELLSLMDKTGIDKAVVSSINSVLYRNCEAGNAELLDEVKLSSKRLIPLVTINPAYAGWQKDFENAVKNKSVAGIRAYPNYHNYPAEGSAMKELTQRCAKAGLLLFLSVQFEDWRQRHFLDRVTNISGEQVRFLIQETPKLKTVVTNAEGSLIQEIIFGLTKDEAERVYFDNTFIWGPPTNELQRLVNSIGHKHFVFGSHMPFRIPQASLKRIESLEIEEPARKMILGNNILDILRLP